MLVEIIITLAFGIGAFLIFVYYVQKGQFDSSEEVKYQIFHDNEEEGLKKEPKTDFKEALKKRPGDLK